MLRVFVLFVKKNTKLENLLRDFISRWPINTIATQLCTIYTTIISIKFCDKSRQQTLECTASRHIHDTRAYIYIYLERTFHTGRN